SFCVGVNLLGRPGDVPSRKLALRRSRKSCRQVYTVVRLTPTRTATSATDSPSPRYNSAVTWRISRGWPRCTASRHTFCTSLTVAPQKRTVMSTGYLLLHRFSGRGFRVRYPAAFPILFLKVYSRGPRPPWL